MKISFALVFVTLFCFTASADRCNEHEAYLAELLLSLEHDTAPLRAVDDRSSRHVLPTVSEGFAISLSERFVNTIISRNIEHEALKRFTFFMRPGGFVIDGLFYLEMLDLEIPFTVNGIMRIKPPSSILLDVKEAKIWQEGSLPTHIIIDRVINLLLDNSKDAGLTEYVYVSYESVSVRGYDRYGRIIIIPRLANLAPTLANLQLTHARLYEKSLLVRGR